MREATETRLLAPDVYFKGWYNPEDISCRQIPTLAMKYDTPDGRTLHIESLHWNHIDTLGGGYMRLTDLHDDYQEFYKLAERTTEDDLKAITAKWYKAIADFKDEITEASLKRRREWDRKIRARLDEGKDGRLEACKQ